jgi:hypothetical protein
MGSLNLKTGRSLTPDMRRRLLLAIVGSAATGVIIYVLVMHVAMPAVEGRLSPAHFAWLREAFANHPLVVLGVITLIAAVLAAPVLGVFRWVYGPLGQTDLLKPFRLRAMK